MFCSFVFCMSFWHLVVFADTDAVKIVSVMEGDSVSLDSNVTAIQDDDLITWRFGHQKTEIARINKEKGKISTSVVPDGRFRDRLKLDHQTGSLTITNTTNTDSGEYEVTINSDRETIYRFTVTVYAQTTQSTSQSSPQTPPQSSSVSSSQSPSQLSPSHSPDVVSQKPIVLISAAAAGSLLTVTLVGIFWICRKRGKTDQGGKHGRKKETVRTSEDEITYADPIFYKRNVQKAEDEVVYASVVPRR